MILVASCVDVPLLARRDQLHCLQKGPYFKDLVLNKDLFGILGPYWVLIYISGSLFSLFWFHSRKECQFSLHVYELRMYKGLHATN